MDQSLNIKSYLKMKYNLYILLILTLMLPFSGSLWGQSPVPYLSGNGSAKQLMVDGKPFIMLAGELHNSSASGPVYMEPVWERLAGMNLNTVLASVTWEMIEPEEGRFDFSVVDNSITNARQHNLKLVFLWFGTWKNACSSYAPAWVRKDTQRFPRSESPAGAKLNNLTCFGTETCNADSRAFASLMKHIREFEGNEHTVLTIQVENESGIRGDSRDRSEQANNAFGKDVPETLMSFLLRNKDQLMPELKQAWAESGFKTKGTWAEIFGKEADLTFMAWYTACYIDKVAAAGKKEYSLPMYANSWLDTEGSVPGDYPSGGPIAKMVPVWKAGAPHLDLLAPDIYRSDFDVVCGLFQRSGNPLFIPEVMPDSVAAAKAFYAIGQGAICYSPFAIDNQKFFNKNDQLAKSYEVMSALMPYLEKYQTTGTMAGLIGKRGERKELNLGKFRLQVDFTGTENSRLPGYGLVIALADNEYLVAGKGMKVTFISATPAPGRTEILSAYDLVFRNGEWIKDRRLNGDETGEGSDHNIQLRFLEDEIGVKTARVFYYE
jgi:hypothetical protein